MQRHPSLFVGLLLLSAAGAQGQTGLKPLPLGANSPQHGALPAHPSKVQGAGNFGSLPLSFEPNQGQAASQVRFLTHSLGSTLSLNASEAVFTLPPSSGARRKQQGALGKRTAGQSVGKTRAATLRMQLVGANLQANALQEQPMEGKVNYFTNHDPSKWHSNIPTFGKVGFRGVYPGVDVVYYGNRQKLEYDFVVAPHADPKQINLHFAGAKGMQVKPNGDLLLRTQGREMTWQKPTVYQQTATGKHAIPAHYRLKTLPDGQTGVSFALGHYDRARPLIIDPVLIYSSILEGTPSPHAVLALDSSGSVYVAGTTADSQVVGRTYVIKMNPAGTALVYSTYLGPTDFGEPAIAIDSSGSAYIAVNGTTTFPTTAGAYKTQQTDGNNLAVAKLNPSGSALVYSTFIGKNRPAGSSDGSDIDTDLNSGIGIAVDSNGSAYVTGSAGSGFPTTTGAFQMATKAPGSANAFVTKLSPAGDSLVYSTYLGGSVDLGSVTGDAGRGIVVDSSGSAYIVGSTASTDFPTTVGAFQTVNKAAANNNNTTKYNAFVTKLNPAGNGLTYSTLLGGSNFDAGYGIAIDSVGQAYVTGLAASSDFPVIPGAYQSPVAFGSFVTKLNATGSSLVYSAVFGERTTGFAIAIDSAGSAYITGMANAADLPTTVGAFQKQQNSPPQAFISKLNPAGSALVYSTYLGGSETQFEAQGDEGDAIAVDAGGNVYVSGAATNSNFPTTAGAFQIASGLTFVTKLAPVNIFPDYNNDGYTDLLLQNSMTGAIAVWLMQGSTWTGSVPGSLTPLAGYTLVGTGNFSDDRRTTLVFQDSATNKIALWFTALNANSSGVISVGVSQSSIVNTTPAPDWKVVGVGDFNGDGISDLVLQNQTTHQICIWFMGGGLGNIYEGGVLLPTTSAAGWSVVGVGDFNGDGFSDIAFQNQTTGQIALWYMNGTTYVGGTVLATVPAAGWKVVGVGDYNGDGSADLLFQNQTTNQAVVWYLKGGAFAGGGPLSMTPPAGWKIVGPR